MKKIILLIFLCLTTSLTTQAQWQVFKVPTLIPNQGSLLVAPAFINANTGCVGGSDGIRRTINAGETWELVYSSYFVMDIAFADELVGYATPRCYQRCGEIVKTTDAGQTWQRCYVSEDTVYFSDLYVKNKDEVYAIISGYLSSLPPRLYRTTNGGKTWDVILKVNATLRTVCLDNDENLYVAIGGDYFNPSILQFSSNGGTSWNIINHPAGTIGGIKYLFDRLYICCGGCLYFSDNKGETWELAYWFSEGCRDISFLNKNTGYAISISNTAIVYETRDRGLSWKEVYNLGYGTEFRGISLTNQFVYFAGRNYLIPTGIIVRYDLSIQGIDLERGLHKKFILHQNHPNPFNPTTIIKYSVPKKSSATLRIYDSVGREVRTLINEVKTPGNYEVSFDGSNLSSGVYFYKLTAGDFTETKKMLLIK